MARNHEPRPLPQVTAAQHYAPPTARELRAQAVQRLQVGLFGLAAMLLLVALANIINDRIRLAESAAPPVAGAAPVSKAGPASDPLADIGVVPAADPTKDTPPKQGGN